VFIEGDALGLDSNMDSNMAGGVRLEVSPNPAMDNLTLTLSAGEIVSTSLFNAIGHTVWASTTMAGRITLPIANLPAGVYVVQAKDNAGRVFTQKVVVNQ